MFKRLLASKEDPRCQTCFASGPCIRCRRVNRPLGKVTAQGPVCNSCYPYFQDARQCEVCGESSRKLSLLRTSEGEKKACPRCLRVDHRNCASCRKHRACVQVADGAWKCQKCLNFGEVACGSCSALMPAGLGKRCNACYWRERCAHGASQLVELLRVLRVREAFMAFAAWLPAQGSEQRAALALKKHVKFFELLDAAEQTPWNSEFLLRRFGTATLRRYELPMRWIQSEMGLVVSAADKVLEADTRRIRKAITAFPEGSVARELLASFVQELESRRNAGKITERSMRMALRPAVSLLATEDSAGLRIPGQAALDKYLGEVPGQRAAISTFLGFLRSKEVIDLQLPAKATATSSLARKALEKKLLALLDAHGNATRIAKQWVPLALRYFHYMTAKEATIVSAAASRNEKDGGLVLTYKDQDYWVPYELSALFGKSDFIS